VWPIGYSGSRSAHAAADAARLGRAGADVAGGGGERGKTAGPVALSAIPGAHASRLVLSIEDSRYRAPRLRSDRLVRRGIACRTSAAAALRPRRVATITRVARQRLPAQLFPGMTMPGGAAEKCAGARRSRLWLSFIIDAGVDERGILEMYLNEWTLGPARLVRDCRRAGGGGAAVFGSDVSNLTLAEKRKSTASSVNRQALSQFNNPSPVARTGATSCSVDGGRRLRNTQDVAIVRSRNARRW